MHGGLGDNSVAIDNVVNFVIVVITLFRYVIVVVIVPAVTATAIHAWNVARLQTVRLFHDVTILPDVIVIVIAPAITTTAANAWNVACLLTVWHVVTAVAR